VDPVPDSLLFRKFGNAWNRSRDLWVSDHRGGPTVTNQEGIKKRLNSGNACYHSVQNLRVFENKVLRIFGPKRDGVTGGWRKLHNEELHNLYASPSIIRIITSRRMRWAGHEARMGKRNVYRLLVGKQEGKRPLARP
jgi:hypothetical protein